MSDWERAKELPEGPTENVALSAWTKTTADGCRAFLIEYTSPKLELRAANLGVIERYPTKEEVAEAADHLGFAAFEVGEQMLGVALQIIEKEAEDS